MSILDLYEHIRPISRKVNDKISRQNVTSEIVLNASKDLSIFKNNEVLITDDSEHDYIMDYCIFEYRVEDKRNFEVFYEKNPPETEEEIQIHEAFMMSYTSLLEIVSVDKTECIIFLKDVLGWSNEIIKLVDIHMSQCANIGDYLFTRRLKFNDFSMTSGASFVFRKHFIKNILNDYKKIYKKIKLNPLQKKYVAFFKLNRMYGHEVVML